VTPTAATATAPPGVYALLLLLAVVTVWTAGYLLACWLYPFTTCRRCHGTGNHPTPLGATTVRLCRRCHGASRQLRLGRHILNHLRGLHANDHKTTRSR
jgi:hypothetical protein